MKTLPLLNWKCILQCSPFACTQSGNQTVSLVIACCVSSKEERAHWWAPSSAHTLVTKRWHCSTVERERERVLWCLWPRWHATVFELKRALPPTWTYRLIMYTMQKNTNAAHTRVWCCQGCVACVTYTVLHACVTVQHSWVECRLNCFVLCLSPLYYGLMGIKCVHHHATVHHFKSILNSRSLDDSIASLVCESSYTGCTWNSCLLSE